MACSKYASTRQTTHAARMSRLLFGPCTNLLRDVLRQHIPETSFLTTLQNRRVKGILLSLRNLQASQRELLYPQVGTFRGSYADFDISLLYLLLRNITNITPHNNGWGKPPDVTDRSVSANIDRIRMIRNQIGAHCHRHDLSDAVFSTSWAKLKRSVVEIVRSTVISTNYEQFINDLATEPMDPEREDYWLERLQKQIQDNAEKYEEIVKNVDSIREQIEGISNEQVKLTQMQRNQVEVQSKQESILTKHELLLVKQGEVQTTQGSTLTKHEGILSEQKKVLEKQGADIRSFKEAHNQEAKNILDNTEAVLQNHKSSTTYLRTGQVDTVIQKLREQNFVLLTGKPGDGKSTIAKQVLCELSEEKEYVAVIITEPCQWNKVVNSNQKMAVYIDDMFGASNVDTNAIEKWKKIFDIMMSSVNKGKISVLISSRRNIVAEVRKSCHERFLDPEYEIDLTSNKVTSEEKKSMLLQYENVHMFKTSELMGDEFKKYGEWHGKDAVYKLSEWEKKTMVTSEPYYGFPQTCFLFFARKDFFQLGKNFFLRPYRTLYENIDNMRKSVDVRIKMQYCTLAYVFLEGTIHLRDLKEDIFQEICKKLRLPEWTDVDVEDAVQDLEGIYLSPSNQMHIFTFCHVTIREAVAASFGKLAPDTIIQKCSGEILQELIRTEGYEARVGEVVLTIRKKYYTLLANRLLTEDTKDIIYKPALCHPATDDPEFTRVLGDVINQSLQNNGKIIQKQWHMIKSRDKPVLYREILTRYGPHHIKHKAENDGDMSVHTYDSDASVGCQYLIPSEQVKCRLDEYLYKGYKQSVIVIIRYVISHCDINYFLDSYYNVSCGIRGMSVLHCCVARGWTDAVDEILNVASPTKTENNWSCLHFSAFFGRFELFKRFEKLSSNVLESTREGYNILQVILLALRHGKRELYLDLCYLCVSDTYDNSVFLNGISDQENDFINIFQHVMTGYPSLITSIDMPLDRYNNNIIHYLVIHDREELYDMLVQKKKDLVFHRNETDIPTTLHVAAHLGRVKFVEKLWKAGVRTKVTDLSIAESVENGKKYNSKTLTYEGSCWRCLRDLKKSHNIKLRCIMSQSVRFGSSEDYTMITSLCSPGN